MRNAGLWTYRDSESIGSPVDYHEVRGHLRLGTVRIVDEELSRKVGRGAPVEEEDDIAIRSAVGAAIALISDLSGVRNPMQLHYLFWNVFRSCCPIHSTHCTTCPSNCTLPETYRHLGKTSSGQRHCAFSSVCASAGLENKLVEHFFETDFY
jgi:hypothetical protein